MSVLDELKANSLIAPAARPHRKRELPAGPYRPGQSGNPSGRPKTPRWVVDACRALSPRAVECLEEIVERFLARDGDIRAGEAKAAAQALLDRAYGTAPQVVRVEQSDLDDTLALDPTTLDLDALAHLAVVVRCLRPPASPRLEAASTPGRAPTAEPADDSEGVSPEGTPGSDTK